LEPSLPCFESPEGGAECLSREEFAELALKVLDDLELVGLVRREGSRIVYNVPRMGTMIWPCFLQMREAFEEAGLLEELRGRAEGDPWLWACRVASYCVAFLLAGKRMDYGEADAMKAAEFPDGYLAVLNMAICAMLEAVFGRDEVAKLFKAAFEI